jgi:hypothetical protein
VSNSRLPPLPGLPPPKITYEGLDAATPEGQRAIHQLQGHISRFHGKARQSVDLSGTSGQHMHGSLPGGGVMRYTYNNGLEELNVRVPVTRGAPAEETLERPEPPVVVTPMLAIDVLFTNVLFMAGDVYSKTRESHTVQQWEWVPGDPIPIDPHDPAVTTLTYNLNDTMSGWNGDSIGEDPGEHWTSTGATIITATDGSDGGSGHVLTNPYRDSVGATGPSLDGFLIRSWQQVESIGPFTGPFGGVTPWSDFLGFAPGVTTSTIDAPYRKIFVLTSESFWFAGEGGLRPTWIGRLGAPVEVTSDTHVRDQSSFFDVLNVVGLRVEDDPDDPADAPYEAISTQSSADGRLRALSPEPAVRTASRALRAAESPPPGYVGEGFLAAPQKPPTAGDDNPPPTTIDVYLSSTNIIKANTYPGPVGATFEADDPSFSYDVKQDIDWNIRVREFVDDAPIIVGVTTTTERRNKHWTGEPNNEPTTPGDDEDVPSSRTAEWNFAAGSTWTDQHGEPADPSVVTSDGKPTMGKLLRELTGTTEVTGPVPLGRVMREAPFWSGSVVGMTKIATIVWTPATDPNEQGSALITPA